MSRRVPQTVLGYLLDQKNLTYEEAAKEIETFARINHESATISSRHLARLARGERSQSSMNPATRRLLEKKFQRPIGDLLSPWAPNTELENPTVVNHEHNEDDLESPLEIAQRCRRMNAVNIDDMVLGAFDLALDDIIDRYEGEGPIRLAGETITLRRQIDTLLQEHQHPIQRRHLYVLAAKLSAMLGYMAVNRGRFRHAQAYCHEAFGLASVIEDRELQAWIRGTESFAFYYQGRFEEALSIARDGLRYAGNGPQAVRLLINGEARALGRLGDPNGVSHAVDRAFTLLSSLDSPSGLTSCIAFGGYGEARVAANAATAYLSLGDTQHALEYGNQVEHLVDDSDSIWSRSLVRLDIATALLRAKSPEVEHAMLLGQEALAVSAESPIRSVWQRAHEMYAEANRYGDLLVVRDYAESLRSWSQRSAGFATVGNERPSTISIAARSKE